jgi:hypothetical protein
VSNDPQVRVVSGSPTDEELAIVIALASALGTDEAAKGSTPMNGWGDHRRAMRTPLPHGDHAWRASALPR